MNEIPDVDVDRLCKAGPDAIATFIACTLRRTEPVCAYLIPVELQTFVDQAKALIASRKQNRTDQCGKLFQSAVQLDCLNNSDAEEFFERLSINYGTACAYGLGAIAEPKNVERLKHGADRFIQICDTLDDLIDDEQSTTATKKVKQPTVKSLGVYERKWQSETARRILLGEAAKDILSDATPHAQLGTALQKAADLFGLACGKP
jgi:hypothetical protein